LGPECVQRASDPEIVDLFAQLVETEAINGGAVTGLSSHQFADRSGRLLPRGLEMIKVIGTGYEIAG